MKDTYNWSILKWETILFIPFSFSSQKITYLNISTYLKQGLHLLHIHWAYSYELLYLHSPSRKRRKMEVRKEIITRSLTERGSDAITWLEVHVTH